LQRDVEKIRGCRDMQSSKEVCRGITDRNCKIMQRRAEGHRDMQREYERGLQKEYRGMLKNKEAYRGE
jgi:hypothetical protein